MDSVDSLDIDYGASATAIDILSEGASTVRRTPGIFGVYLIAAVLGLMIEPLNSILPLVAGGIAVVMAYTTLGGRPENNVSLGVRLIIVLIAGIIAGLITLVGFILLIIPGIYLAVRLRLVTAAVMLEDCGPIEALSRSFSLTRNHTWTIFVVGLVLSAISLMIGLAILLASGAFSTETISTATYQGPLRLTAAITMVLIAPLGTSANAVMFGLYNQDHR